MRRRLFRSGKKKAALFPSTNNYYYNNNNNNNNNMDLHVNNLQQQQLQQQQIQQQYVPSFLTPENVASVPPPGLSGPSQIVFAPMDKDNSNRNNNSSCVVAYIATVPKPSKTTTTRTSVRSSYYRPLTQQHQQPHQPQQKTNSTSSSVATATERILMCLDVDKVSSTSSNINSSNSSHGKSNNHGKHMNNTKPFHNNDNDYMPPQPLLQWSIRRSTGGSNRSNSRINSSNHKRRAVDASSTSLSLEERLRRERQRASTAAGSLTQFSWVIMNDDEEKKKKNNSKKKKKIKKNNYSKLRLLVPARGSLYIQDGIELATNDDNDNTIQNNTTTIGNNNNADNVDDDDDDDDVCCCTCIHDKSVTGLSAMDAQLSPDGMLVAWTADGELYVQSANPGIEPNPAIRISFGAVQSDTCCITHGIADFVAQEEMDRYKGFWWHPNSNAILFCRNDETEVPIYRIMHHNSSTIMSSSSPSSSNSGMMSDNSNSQHDNSSHGGFTPTKPETSSAYEDHRYPFAGKLNPTVRLGLVKIDRESILLQAMAIQETAIAINDPSSTLSRAATATTTTNHHHRVVVETRSDSNNIRNDCDSHDDDDDDDMMIHDSLLLGNPNHINDDNDNDNNNMQIIPSAQEIAMDYWNQVQWLDAPREANEYLARVHWLPDGCAVVQWQNRQQTCSVLYRIDLRDYNNTDNSNNNNDNDSNTVKMDTSQQSSIRPGRGKGRTLLIERTDVWINLHHMFYVLPRSIHPDELEQSSEEGKIPPMPIPLPDGSFTFIFASERTGYTHLYLYTYCPGINGEQAVLLRTITDGKYIVESIQGVDIDKDVVYFTGTYDSPLERHLYAIPLLGKSNKHYWRTNAIATIHDTFIPNPKSVSTINNSNNNNNSSAPMTTTTTTSEESSIAASSSNVFHTTTTTTTTSTSNNGVRRGLSKMMHALSGKSSRSNNSSSQRFLGQSDSNTEVTFSSGSQQHQQQQQQQTREGPTRLTTEHGMHSIVMDDNCRYFVDTSSDLDRPTTVQIYELPTDNNMYVRKVMTLYDAMQDDTIMLGGTTKSKSKGGGNIDLKSCLRPPELMSFPTSDGTETLHAAVYRPDPRIHGPGPYPLVCAVYGGPHVQRVNRSWSQSADMRAQRLRSLGFCVMKCDNRGSSRRGLSFESAISRRLGRIEVLDQVAAVRQLIVRGVADANRVGVYGWSYGGYLSAMCLCRAPDVFHVAVAGAPVTNWDGYDTHYTERYMGLPADNPAGYRESAVFDHVPNMRGKLMIVHGLIDENVHFRHTTRLISKLVSSGKDYDLLIFPEERHSPRRLRDRIYMEQRISDYFLRHLGPGVNPTALDLVTASIAQRGNNNNSGGSIRNMAGHL